MKLDICVLTETWFSNTDTDSIWTKGSELNRNGYKMKTVNRKKAKRGGGLAPIHRENIAILKDYSDIV